VPTDGQVANFPFDPTKNPQKACLETIPHPLFRKSNFLGGGGVADTKNLYAGANNNLLNYLYGMVQNRAYNKNNKKFAKKTKLKHSHKSGEAGGYF